MHVKGSNLQGVSRPDLQTYHYGNYNSIAGIQIGIECDYGQRTWSHIILIPVIPLLLIMLIRIIQLDFIQLLPTIHCYFENARMAPTLTLAFFVLGTVYIHRPASLSSCHTCAHAVIVC